MSFAFFDDTYIKYFTMGRQRGENSTYVSKNECNYIMNFGTMNSVKELSLPKRVAHTYINGLKAYLGMVWELDEYSIIYFCSSLNYTYNDERIKSKKLHLDLARIAYHEFRNKTKYDIDWSDLYSIQSAHKTNDKQYVCYGSYFCVDKGATEKEILKEITPLLESINKKFAEQQSSIITVEIKHTKQHNNGHQGLVRVDYENKIEQISELRLRGINRKHIIQRLGITIKEWNNIYEYLRRNGRNFPKYGPDKQTRNAEYENILSKIAEYRLKGYERSEIVKLLGISKLKYDNAYSYAKYNGIVLPEVDRSIKQVERENLIAKISELIIEGYEKQYILLSLGLTANDYNTLYHYLKTNGRKFPEYDKANRIKIRIAKVEEQRTFKYYGYLLTDTLVEMVGELLEQKYTIARIAQDLKISTSKTYAAIMHIKSGGIKNETKEVKREKQLSRINEYVKDGKSVDEIAKLENMTCGGVYKILEKSNKNLFNKKKKDRIKRYNKYFDKGLTYEQIAEKENTSVKAVQMFKWQCMERTENYTTENAKKKLDQMITYLDKGKTASEIAALRGMKIESVYRYCREHNLKGRLVENKRLFIEKNKKQ